MISDSVRKQAEHFLYNETPFHLGEMLTEQPHRVTKTLSQTLQTGTAAGLLQLLQVDDDIVPVLKKTIHSAAFQNLRSAILRTLNSGHRVFFSGCGATGRLAILLDAAHRRFCRKKAVLLHEKTVFFETLAEQTFSVMTGGDFALIRSVESFEDYIEFGKRQMFDAGIEPEDCLIAVSEGGETSSVIGTIHAAIETGAKTFFLYNNPTELMCRMVGRSRNVMTDPRVQVLCLATGPMAVAGSTRMQATTIELLAAGLAFESALDKLLHEKLTAEELEKIHYVPQIPLLGLERFQTLLRQVRQEKNLRVLADWTEYECSVYQKNGLITYFPDEYVLDIFTDTTERSPTFKIPPFRSTLETAAPVSWAFVKDPVHSTENAWEHLLGRKPCCIEWTQDDYERMGAAQRIIDEPPKIDQSVLKTYLIGNEPDTSRRERSPNAALAFLAGNDLKHLTRKDEWYDAFLEQSGRFERRGAVFVGTGIAVDAGVFDAPVFAVDVHLPESPLELITHTAIKIVLNNVSTAAMGKLGRLNGNWMAHVDATNKKLIDRSIRLVSELAAVNYETACYALFESLEEISGWTEAKRKTVSPAAYTVERLKKQ
ncbi:MAG: hypothetical protein LBN39_00485 [Planctomycetaceae bacterium]|jgi:N-acetylmuramic acid 6-phosphate etherase|nr:hypothetical protein [Planctomycetaceae bacterium]